MDDEDFIIEEAPDVESFCLMLRDAWLCVPHLNFPKFLEEVFNGYNLNDITTEEQEEYLKDFILNNM